MTVIIGAIVHLATIVRTERDVVQRAIGTVSSVAEDSHCAPGVPWGSRTDSRIHGLYRNGAAVSEGVSTNRVPRHIAVQSRITLPDSPEFIAWKPLSNSAA